MKILFLIFLGCILGTIILLFDNSRYCRTHKPQYTEEEVKRKIKEISDKTLTKISNNERTSLMEELDFWESELYHITVYKEAHPDE